METQQEQPHNNMEDNESILTMTESVSGFPNVVAQISVDDDEPLIQHESIDVLGMHDESDDSDADLYVEQSNDGVLAHSDDAYPEEPALLVIPDDMEETVETMEHPVEAQEEQPEEPQEDPQEEQSQELLQHPQKEDAQELQDEQPEEPNNDEPRQEYEEEQPQEPQEYGEEMQQQEVEPQNYEEEQPRQDQQYPEDQRQEFEHQQDEQPEYHLEEQQQQNEQQESLDEYQQDEQPGYHEEYQQQEEEQPEYLDEQPQDYGEEQQQHQDPPEEYLTEQRQDPPEEFLADEQFEYSEELHDDQPSEDNVSGVFAAAIPHHVVSQDSGDDDSFRRDIEQPKVLVDFEAVHSSNENESNEENNSIFANSYNGIVEQLDTSLLTEAKSITPENYDNVNGSQMDDFDEFLEGDAPNPEATSAKPDNYFPYPDNILIPIVTTSSHAPTKDSTSSPPPPEPFLTPRRVNILVATLCFVLVASVGVAVGSFLAQQSGKTTPQSSSVNANENSTAVFPSSSPSIAPTSDVESPTVPPTLPVPAPPVATPTAERTSVPTAGTAETTISPTVEPSAPLVVTLAPTRAITVATASPTTPKASPAPTAAEDDVRSVITAALTHSTVDLDDMNTPAGKAFDWVSLNSADLPSWRMVQQFSLAGLAYSAGVDAWLGSENECSWSGITCDSSGRVFGIELREDGLQGKLFPELYLLSDSLVTFNAGQNSMGGTIPTQVGMLRNLQLLQLDRNMFSGPIPGTLGRLMNLQILNLEENSLTGALPAKMENMPLLHFRFYSNGLTGSIFESWCRRGNMKLEADCNEIDCPCCSVCY